MENKLNPLARYVRKTVLSAAKEYAHPKTRRTAESTQMAFKDAMQGTTTGWWNDLIYTSAMLVMARRYRVDIRDAILDFMSETGARHNEDCQVLTGRSQAPLTYGEIVMACSLRPAGLLDDRSQDAQQEREVEAALFGLRFAVENICGNLARDYAPNL